MTERGFRDPISRRDLIKTGLAGAAGLTALPALIAACNAVGVTATPTAAATPLPTASPTPAPTPVPSDFLSRRLSGQLKLGTSYAGATGTYPDAAEKAGMEAIDADFVKLTGLQPTLNLFNPYGAAVTSVAGPVPDYLNGTPDDLLNWPWCAGYVMRDCAQKGLILPIDEVWALVKDKFGPGLAGTVTGDDGKVYGIPADHNPWAMFYRKSIWAAHGYDVPTTWDQLLALCARMKKDGLTPIAFGDLDGWPALGTFDVLNLRLNGYQFRMDLLAGKAKWTDDRVTDVFTEWTKLLPYYTGDCGSIAWEAACDTLIRGQAGMSYMGLFMAGEVATVDGSVLDDIDFFEFPYLGNEFDAEAAVDATVDLWVMPARSTTLEADRDNARAYLEFVAQGSTQLTMYQAQPSFVPASSDVDASKLDRLSAKSLQLVGRAQRITNFFDRDTRPDGFAGADGMQSFLHNFVIKPGLDIAEFQRQIQGYWDALPPYGQ